jgi:predicted nucleic acid-binding protein
MNQILVDTSVWIDFFNLQQSPSAATLQKLIEENRRICLCPMIYQEILQGIRDDKIFEEIKQILQDFNMLNLDILEVSNFAIDIYRKLRKQGITIRKSMDCLIAAYSVLGNMPLLHKDRDFQEIAKVCRLTFASDAT